jgi:hypothetical protein
MKRRIGNKIAVVLLVAIVALASLGMGFGLWSGTLTLTGTVSTGNIDLVFVDSSDTGTVNGLPSPFTDDDNKRDDPTLVRDPDDTGLCPSAIQGPYDDDEDGLMDEDPINGADDDGDQNEDGSPGDPGDDQCSDGNDNDGDGAIDAADSDCQAGPKVDEDPDGKRTSCDPRVQVSWSVSGRDDDGDQHEDGSVGSPGDNQCSDGLDNDLDGNIDDADTACQTGPAVDEDPVEAFNDDGDSAADEDPPGDFNGDGCPGICGFDDDADGFTDEGPIADDDEDGLVDEDPPEPPIDNDGDGLFDEDNVGRWVITPTTIGPDRGTALLAGVNVDSDLQVQIFRPYVSPPDVLGGTPNGYAPTLYYHLDNLGSVPIIVADVSIREDQEIWERDGDGVIIDLGRNRMCDPGDECASAVVGTITGTTVGTYIDANPATPAVEGQLHIAVTLASQPGNTYSLDVGITGHNFNEP